MGTHRKLLSFLYLNKELNRHTQLQEKQRQFTRMWGTSKGGLRLSGKKELCGSNNPKTQTLGVLCHLVEAFRLIYIV